MMTSPIIIGTFVPTIIRNFCQRPNRSGVALRRRSEILVGFGIGGMGHG